MIANNNVGTDEANLSHFWRANNWVKFKNIKKCSQIPKYYALGDPLVKLQLVISPQIRDMIISPRPIFEWGSNLSHFGLFVLG